MFREAALSLYFFDVRSYGEPQDFRGGASMPDDDAALAHGRRIIQELRRAGGYEDDGLTLVVRNSTGRTVYSIPFMLRSAASA